jgi:hypothetical protein
LKVVRVVEMVVEDEKS